MSINRLNTVLFSILIFFGINCNAQTYGDKGFYLIDSLDLDQLNPNEFDLLDSCLIEYSKAKEDTSKLRWIMLLPDEMSSDDVSERYTLFAKDYINSRINKSFLSREESVFYYFELANVYSNLGYYENNRGAKSKALNNYHEALKIYEAFDVSENLGVLYLNFSSLYFGMCELDLALDYSNKALEVSQQLEGEPELMIYALNNLAVIYAEKGDTEKSLENQFKSLAICDSTGNKNGSGMINNNIGGVYSQTDRPELAFKHYKLAEKTFLELKNDTWISYTYQKMGSTYLNEKQYVEARKYANLCYDYAELSGGVQPKLRAANLLYRLNEKTGNYKDAFYYFRKHEHLADSISGEEIKVTTRQMEMDFQIEKEKALADKENEKKLEVSSEREKQQKFISYAIFGGLILVCIFMFILFFRLRTITKQKKVIEKQNDERKLLLKEIHHRVKNNFQIVSSVLKLQAAEENNSVIDHAFDDAINRIHSMAAVHEMIYMQNDFAAVAPKSYFRKLTDSMRTYTLDRELSFEVDSNVEALSVQTLIPLGISVNEMITNSIKYAFADNSIDPKICISLNKRSMGYTLSYRDNGVGFESQLKSDSFGMELIETILEQIDGKLEKVEDAVWSTHLKIHF
ncbi:MAG: two-component sensor histidine kinase [Crocinitomix sp.]|jgi:two-component sensor histidine kinase